LQSDPTEEFSTKITETLQKIYDKCKHGILSHDGVYLMGDSKHAQISDVNYANIAVVLRMATRNFRNIQLYAY
jgi:hypothetical protein